MQRGLFGGAITCNIPNGWRDVSDIRQVPDHQECWQEAQEGGGRVLVVEILERQSTVNDEEAAEYFFKDLAGGDANAANYTSKFESISSNQPMITSESLQLPPTAKICLGMGYQCGIKMGRDKDISGNIRQNQEQRDIKVEVGVVRLPPSKETDILITLSLPCDNSSQQETTTTTAATDAAAATTTTISETFQQIITSFRINDWTLFG